MLTLTSYAATLAAFLVIDFLWLGVAAKRFYAAQLGPLLRAHFNLPAVGAFYLVYVAGIVYFAVMPALAEGSLATAALNGALLGLLAYGTYDMTNLATLKGWPLAMSLVDMAWGSCLTGGSAAVGFLAARALEA